MNPDTPSQNFDGSRIAADLVGTWRFPFDEGPGYIGLIHFTDTGRTIQFLYRPEGTRAPSPMRLWHSVESATHLRFRPKPDHAGWLRGYRFEGVAMILSSDEHAWVCTRASAEEIPAWFRSALESALAQE